MIGVRPLTMSHARPQHLGITLKRLLRLLPHLGVVRRLSRGSENLFNVGYYLAANPDVAASRMHPLLHFLVFGAFEKRKPNPLFDPEFYLRKYSDVAQGETNPLVHYLKCGAAEGRMPHPLLDPDPEMRGAPGDSLAQFLRALNEPPESVLYSWWMRQEARIAPPPLTSRPRFSVLITASRPRRDWLVEAIASVRAQSYPQWELCVSNNGSNESWLQEDLTLAARADARIRVAATAREVPAPVALNGAATLATGDYIVVLGQGDRLAPNALHWLATMAPADLIYSDEDRLDTTGKRSQPLFKPAWSPDLLLSCMYLGRIMAISRLAWENAAGFRPAHEHAWEYDLALRVTEKSNSVQHVPRVLYSRREEEATVSQDDNARQCLLDAIERRGISAEVESGPRPCSFRVHWRARRTALANVIICSRSPLLLERCLASLASRTSYPCREVIVVQHLDRREGGLEAVSARFRAVPVVYSGPFHFSRMNNLGTTAAKGAILVFLNDDTELLDSFWLDRLVALIERPDVGVAGSRLLYPSGALQHGGVAIGIGDGCAHIGRETLEAVPHWPWLDLTRDVSAVTGACLAIRTSVFHEVGGFADEFPVNYNDIDLCLRVREAGYRVIYEAGSVLRHYECQTRRAVVTPEERSRWSGRWAKAMAAGDPFYSPNLTHEYEDLSLRNPAEGLTS